MCNTQSRFKALISACVMSLIATTGWSQSLTWLGTLGGNISSAHDVSADGSVVVGVARGSNGFYRPFRWTPGGGMQDLGTLGGRHGEATRVSPNGATIVGAASTVNSSASGYIDSAGFLLLHNNHREHPFRWTQGSGMQDLGTLGDCCGWANSVSADGGVVVGWASASRRWSAFRWENDQMRDLGTLGGARSIAHSVSADGGVVVGWAQNASGQLRAFRWENDQMRDLGTLGGAESYAWGVSADGGVVVGSAQNASGQWRAFRWENNQMRDLGTLGGAESYARGVSANGRVVVGWAQNASGQLRAFRWTENGIEDLSQTYAYLLSGGSYFIAAHEVSEDGRYIVGYGYNATSRRYEAFLLDTCLGGDADKDCICDDWERAGGIDINGDGIIDVQLPNAQVGRKDIYVEYDAMAGFAPSADVLNRVQAAFAAHNIGLHFINGGDLGVAPADWPDPWAGFDAFKRNYFGTPEERASPNWENIRQAKQRVFRYCVFARSIFGGSISGLAELPGNDFMVTLGHPDWQAIRDRLPAVWDGRRVTWDDFVAGTLMHELGHVLGQRHGGGDHLHFKPNYHSVMNYLWQVPQPGYASSWLLDYSDSLFNILDENNLSEPDGIGGHAGHRVPIGGRGGRIVNERGPVDWNNDGDTNDRGVRFDANGDGAFGVLRGFDNWANIDCACGSPNWADGVHLVLGGTEADLEEMTVRDWLDLARIGLPSGDASFDGCVDDADLLAVLFVFGQTGDLPEDVNDDGVVDDADLLQVLFNFGSGC
jgi:probable HAF family extracellular repeat protein